MDTLEIVLIEVVGLDLIIIDQDDLGELIF